MTTQRISRIVKRRPNRLYRRFGDRLFQAVIIGIAVVVVAIAIALAVVLAADGAAAFAEFGIIGFLTGTVWNPVAEVFGAWPFLLGTIVTSVIALGIAVLPALGVAIFTAEYAPRWLSTWIDYFVDLLAAIPSVVIGIWGIFVLVPYMQANVYQPLAGWAVSHAPALSPVLGNPSGYSIATATLVLALMVVPYTVAIARDALRLVPQEQREAAWGLGATKWEVIRVAVLPYARGGIIGGAVLSFGRAIGETMAVAMLIGNANSLPFTLFGPAATMPSVIVNEFREAMSGLHLSSLMGIGMVLFVISLLVNLGASWLQRKLAVNGQVV